jgi:hypothetical protein
MAREADLQYIVDKIKNLILILIRSQQDLNFMKSRNSTLNRHNGACRGGKHVRQPKSPWRMMIQALGWLLWKSHPCLGLQWLVLWQNQLKIHETRHQEDLNVRFLSCWISAFVERQQIRPQALCWSVNRLAVRHDGQVLDSFFWGKSIWYIHLYSSII